jgi:glycosyltransferase involved in cell wall biosynthesis
MEKLANDIFSLWQEEGRQNIQQNFEVFHSLVAQTKDFADRGKYDAAAVYAQIAGLHAVHQHCGLLASFELEHILISIGLKTIPSSLYKNNSVSGQPKNILHVATNIAEPFSGIPRLLRRWIQQDSGRSHSLVLTQQSPRNVPEICQEAVNKSNGKIYLLNGCIGGFVSRAKRLREIAASVDVVVVHALEHDVIPTIAFANKLQSPPVIRVNHGDNCFWFGVSTSDTIANLRESGMHLSENRRGIKKERNMLIPTVLEPFQRTLSRAEAKQKLGLPENCILLLSIARPPKYRSIEGISFADTHIQLLKKYDRAILIVVGPGESEDWSSAIEETQGRIIVLKQTEDTAVFYQAADVYIDSFPFVSITSLLEAGSYGVPLVTRYPYSDGCEILGADMPGLNGNLIRVQDTHEYEAALSHLVEDETFRLSLGEATKRKITETHIGNNWLKLLDDMYFRTIALPRLTIQNPHTDRMFLGEPDAFFPRIHGFKLEMEQLLRWHLNVMPPGLRFRFWINDLKKHGFSGFEQLKYLLPEWLKFFYLMMANKLGNNK